MAGKRSKSSRGSTGPGRSPNPARAPAVSSALAWLRKLQALEGWRAWLVNVGTAILVPTFLIVLSEGALRLAGFGYKTDFCLIDKSRQSYVENDNYLWQFYSRKTGLRPNPFALPLYRSPGSLRVLILGESAAAGTPDPAYNFGRILERMLLDDFPKAEVVNVAMRGVNSHILLPVARDCMRLRPDLVVVYMGNNEAVGLYAPGPHSGRLTPYLKILRMVQWLRTTKVGQALEPLLMGLDREGAPSEKQDDAFFAEHRVAADDPRRRAVYNNFAANLGDVCASARGAGAKVVLMTVAVNLRDSPPFGSLHRSGLSEGELRQWEAAVESGIKAELGGDYHGAAGRYREAMARDDHYAELHFRLARACETLGQIDDAHREFALARDWDALQFRADTRLNEVVRKTAAVHGATLVDAEAALAEASGPLRSPGDALFHDHVHPTFEGDYLLAKALLPAVRAALAAEVGPAPVLSREECAARLAFTRFNEGQIAAEMVKARALPPFTGQYDHALRQKALEQQVLKAYGSIQMADVEKAAEAYLSVIQRYPQDWRLRYNLGRLDLLRKAYADAQRDFMVVRDALPHWPPIYLALSGALEGEGKSAEAAGVLREGLKASPGCVELEKALARLQGETR